MRHRTQRGSAAVGVLIGIASLAALAGIVIGGWQLNWWLKSANANRTAHVIRQGYSNQQTLREQITVNIGTVLSVSTQIAESSGDPQVQGTLRAQRTAILAIVCQDADEVTGDQLPLDQQTFVQANCLAGVVNPSSSYNGGNS